MSTCPYIIRPLAVATVVRPVYEEPTQCPLCILLMATFGSQLVNITSAVYINKHIGLFSVLNTFLFVLFHLEVIDLKG